MRISDDLRVEASWPIEAHPSRNGTVTPESAQPGRMEQDLNHLTSGACRSSNLPRNRLILSGAPVDAVREIHAYVVNYRAPQRNCRLRLSSPTCNLGPVPDQSGGGASNRQKCS